MITKMLASDAKLSPEIALCWALNAKNSLENCFGFTPAQLHIGRTPVLPSVTRDGPPLYNNETISERFATHLNAKNAARQEFVKAESSIVLKRALKSRVYSRGDDIQEGDWIYYRKNNGFKNDVIWNGPSKVISMNGKKLFVDQGARQGTVNRDNAVKVGEELWRMDEENGAAENIQGKQMERIKKVPPSNMVLRSMKKILSSKVEENKYYSPSSESDNDQESTEEEEDDDREVDENHAVIENLQEDSEDNTSTVEVTVTTPSVSEDENVTEEKEKGGLTEEEGDVDAVQLSAVEINLVEEGASMSEEVLDNVYNGVKIGDVIELN